MTASSVAVRIGLPVRRLSSSAASAKRASWRSWYSTMRSSPWSGVEAALAHHPRLVGLDPEAEVHDGVDVGVGGDQLHHGGDRVPGLPAGAVDRVVAAPPRRQLGVDRRPQVVRQREQPQVAVAGDGVRGDDAPAAGGRQHDDVRAGGCRLGGERRRGLERLLHRGGSGDPGRPALAVEHGVVGGERAGVAGRGAGAALGRPTLQQDERLARRPPMPGGRISPRPSAIPST